MFHPFSGSPRKAFITFSLSLCVLGLSLSAAPALAEQARPGEAVFKLLESGNQAELQKRLKLGDINAFYLVPDSGLARTPLMWAAEAGKPELVKWLLAHKADPKLKEPEFGNDALLLAISAGQLASARALVANGASLATHNQDGETPLMAAAAQSDPELVQWLLDQKQDLSAHDKLDNDALMYAVWNGQLACARLLVSKGADPRELTHENVNLLMVAADRGSVEIATWLVEEVGLEVGALDVNQASALLHAVWSGQVAVAEYLATQGANTHETWNGSDLLMYLAPAGHVPMAGWLIDSQQISVHTRDASGSNALFLAAGAGHMGLVEYLVERGASPHRRDGEGRTLLMKAVYGKQPELVSWLLESLRLNPNARDTCRRSVLDHARSAGNPEIFGLLQAAGAQPGNNTCPAEPDPETEPETEPAAD